LADWHLGSRECDLAQIKRDIEAIKRDPRARALIPGDVLNFETRFSVGDVEEQLMPVDEQEEMALDLLSPIAKKIEVMLEGNHERRTKEHNKAIKRMAKRLGVRFQPTEAILEMEVGRKRNGKPASYLVYVTHGYGAGRTIGATANMLDSFSQSIYADVYIGAHTHKREVHDDLYRMPDCQNKCVRYVHRVYVCLGASQAHAEYAKAKVMKAQPTGATVIRLSGKEKRVTVEL
jgi:predicted phosphodiesterase